MKLSFISDLHIQNDTDEAAELLKLFLKSDEVQSSDHVYLLGDIFEFLVGEHKSYIKEYPTIFNSITSLISRNIKVTFIEGNHDFHFQKTFTNHILSEGLDSSLFEYRTEGEYLKLNGEKLYFCHGDEVDYYNVAFKRWKRIYTSLGLRILVSYILPYWLLNKIGHSASKDSKRRGNKTFNFEKAKLKYRIGAEALLKERDLDGVVCGHTHIQEIYSIKDVGLYINCGFPLRNKNFIHFNGNSWEKINLKES